MYDVDPALPVETLPAGAYAVTGPALSYKYELLCSLLTAGAANGDGTLFVSTDEPAPVVARDLGWDGQPPASGGIVDCISQQSGGVEGTVERVGYVSSPADLTGIGMYASEQLSRLVEEEGLDRTRVALHSLSTLFMYGEFRPVLQFLHVFAHRLEAADALGLLAVDPDSHDRQVVETVYDLTDGMIEVREGDGEGEVRVVQRSGDRSDWISI